MTIENIRELIKIWIMAVREYNYDFYPSLLVIDDLCKMYDVNIFNEIEILKQNECSISYSGEKYIKKLNEEKYIKYDIKEVDYGVYPIEVYTNEKAAIMREMKMYKP